MSECGITNDGYDDSDNSGSGAKRGSVAEQGKLERGAERGMEQARPGEGVAQLHQIWPGRDSKVPGRAAVLAELRAGQQAGPACRDTACPFNLWLYSGQRFPDRSAVVEWDVSPPRPGRHESGGFPGARSPSFSFHRPALPPGTPSSGAVLPPYWSASPGRSVHSCSSTVSRAVG